MLYRSESSPSTCPRRLWHVQLDDNTWSPPPPSHGSFRRWARHVRISSRPAHLHRKAQTRVETSPGATRCVEAHPTLSNKCPLWEKVTLTMTSTPLLLPLFSNFCSSFLISSFLRSGSGLVLMLKSWLASRNLFLWFFSRKFTHFLGQYTVCCHSLTDQTEHHGLSTSVGSKVWQFSLFPPTQQVTS